MRCNFYNFLSKKKIGRDPPYDIHIYSYQVQSEFKIQGMENYYFLYRHFRPFRQEIWNWNIFPRAKRDTDCLGEKKRKKKRIVYESWVPGNWRCVDESGYRLDRRMTWFVRLRIRAGAGRWFSRHLCTNPARCALQRQGYPLSNA